jgi:polyphosphate glucokinase
VAEVVGELLSQFPDASGPVGITVPGVVHAGVVRTAANIDSSWIDTDADALFTDRLGVDVHVVNDADAAGAAEVAYGAARGQRGLVIVTTLGTGIGSAMIHNGVLVPSSELGHIEIGGRVAEEWTANSVREQEDLSWEEWAERLRTYYRTLERLFSPDLFVVGGGVSKHADHYLPLLDIDTRIVPAELRNQAGIVGAALVAAGREAAPS